MADGKPVEPAGKQRQWPGRTLLLSIKEEARKQIRAAGATALSLRAIARSLGITAPAIYNYFHRRDDLVTELIVDGYTALGESQAAALAGLDGEDHAARLLALGVAYRKWALANRGRFALMFGGPHPGSRIRPEVVGPAASRPLAVLVGVLEQARRSGVLREVGSAARGGRAAEGVPPERLEAVYGSSDPGVLQTAVAVWARVHGLVAIELGRQYPPLIADPGLLYRAEIESLVATVIAARRGWRARVRPRPRA